MKWFKIDKVQPPKDEQVLVFSPQFVEADMRIRLIPGSAVADANCTYWAQVTEPMDEEYRVYY